MDHQEGLHSSNFRAAGRGVGKTGGGAGTTVRVAVAVWCEGWMGPTERTWRAVSEGVDAGMTVRTAVYGVEAGATNSVEAVLPSDETSKVEVRADVVAVDVGVDEVSVMYGIDMSVELREVEDTTGGGEAMDVWVVDELL